MSKAIVFPEMDPAEFAEKLARWNARGPKQSKRQAGKETSTFGRVTAAHFDEEIGRRKRGMTNYWRNVRETVRPKDRAE